MKSKKSKIEKNKKETVKNQALKNYQKDVDTERWTCAVCASKGAGQPAAIVRTLRQEGYKFEEVTKGQWSKSMMCNKCGKKQSHYKLLSKYPVNDKNKRYAISDSDTKRLKKYLVIEMCSQIQHHVKNLKLIINAPLQSQEKILKFPI